MQYSNTGTKIGSVADLVPFVSAPVRLEPGDIVATETPGRISTLRDD